MRFAYWSVVPALCLGLASSACKNDDPVKTGLSCRQPSGNYTGCTLQLDAAATFTVKITRNECEQTHNTIKLISPVEATLTEDACHEPINRVWTYDATSYPADTEIDVEFTTPVVGDDPQLRVSGEYPEWTVNFEDGADTDFNDIVLVITATPVT